MLKSLSAKHDPRIATALLYVFVVPFIATISFPVDAIAVLPSIILSFVMTIF